MRKIILIFIVSLFPFATSISQSGWIVQSSNTFENLNGIFFIFNNPNYYSNGWAVGNAGKVIRTTNSGVYWFSVNSPSGYNNNCVYFINPQLGFVGTSNGKIYKTINFGNNWTEYNTTTNNYSVTSLMFSQSGIGWVGNYWGNVIKSSDGGQNWNTIFTTQGYNSIVYCMDDFRTWIVDTYGYVYRTIDGGTSFSNTRPVTSPLRDVKFITSTIGFAVGDSGKVLRSTNGGTNFSLMNSGITANLNSINIINPFLIWAVGDNGIMIKSTDMGITWNQFNYTPYNLKQIYFIPGTTYGYCSGDFGTILRTTIVPGSGGIGNGTIRTNVPFTTQFTDGKTNLLYFSSELTSVIGLTTATINTIGFNFDSISTQPISGLRIKMQNTSLPYLTIFTNSGWTTVFDGLWTPQSTGLQYITLQNPFVWAAPQNLLLEICFNNSTSSINSYVFASNTSVNTDYHYAESISGDGCVLFNGGWLDAIRPNLQLIWLPITTEIIKKENNVPSRFELYQNYPNPFNPVTKIKYDIQKQGFVSLKVFDILGREVADLVSTVQNPGTYIVDFNANDLSGGVYFYKFESSGFVDVKKMILIK